LYHQAGLMLTPKPSMVWYFAAPSIVSVTSEGCADTTEGIKPITANNKMLFTRNKFWLFIMILKLLTAD
jgi:hypothetical protein